MARGGTASDAGKNNPSVTAAPCQLPLTREPFRPGEVFRNGKPLIFAKAGRGFHIFRSLRLSARLCLRGLRGPPCERGEGHEVAGGLRLRRKSRRGLPVFRFRKSGCAKQGAQAPRRWLPLANNVSEKRLTAQKAPGARRVGRELAYGYIVLDRGRSVNGSGTVGTGKNSDFFRHCAKNFV